MRKNLAWAFAKSKLGEAQNSSISLFLSSSFPPIFRILCKHLVEGDQLLNVKRSYLKENVRHKNFQGWKGGTETHTSLKCLIISFTFSSSRLRISLHFTCRWISIRVLSGIMRYLWAKKKWMKNQIFNVKFTFFSSLLSSFTFNTSWMNEESTWTGVKMETRSERSVMDKRWDCVVSKTARATAKRSLFPNRKNRSSTASVTCKRCFSENYINSACDSPQKENALWKVP